MRLHSTLICIWVLGSDGCLCTFYIILITYLFWYVVSVWYWVCSACVIHVHTEAKAQPQLPFCRVRSGFLKQSFSLKLEKYSQAGWPVSPRNWPASTSQPWDYKQAHPCLDFFKDKFWVSSSDPCEYKANALLTEPHPLPCLLCCVL